MTANNNLYMERFNFFIIQKKSHSVGIDLRISNFLFTKSYDKGLYRTSTTYAFQLLVQPFEITFMDLLFNIFVEN